MDDPNPYAAPRGGMRKPGQPSRLGLFEKVGLIIGPSLTLLWSVGLVQKSMNNGQFGAAPGKVIWAAAFVAIVYGMVAAVSFAAIGRVIDYLARRLTKSTDHQE